MLRRLLLPLAGESAYAWVWLLILGFSPLAYWTALRLPVAQVREPHVGSAEALRRAINFGKGLGLRLQDWRAAIQPTLGAEHAILAGTVSWMTCRPRAKAWPRSPPFASCWYRRISGIGSPCGCVRMGRFTGTIRRRA